MPFWLNKSCIAGDATRCFLLGVASTGGKKKGRHFVMLHEFMRFVDPLIYLDGRTRKDGSIGFTMD